MSKALKTITSWIAAGVVAVAVTACGSPGTEETPVPNPIAPATVLPAPDSPAPESPAQESPGEPGDEESGFTGELSTETITANNMDIEIPTGMRIPESTLVTKADSTSIMMADEDPSAVIAMVTQSAEEAGYEVYATPPTGTVFVGHGNAVSFSADANFQLITWGPEVMKDVLAGN